MGSGADSPQGSGGFRRRWLMRFGRVRVHVANKVPGVPVKIPAEGSDVDG